MDHQHLAPPVTLDEFRIKFKLTVGKMKKDTKIEYSIVQLHNQFKVVGLLTKSPYISTFTIDFTPDIVRRFVDCGLPALVLSIKNSFYSFMQSSHSYTTPYGHHTEQTVFYYSVQMHIKILETVNYIPQQQAPFFNTIGVSPSLLPEPTNYSMPQPPTLTQLMPPPPSLCPTPAPQLPSIFEEYDPDYSYSTNYNNKRKKYTPTKVNESNNESSTQ